MPFTPAAKRQRLDPSAENENETRNVLDDVDEDDIDIQLPSDTVIAFKILRDEFPSSAKVAPLVLRSQIYDIAKDRTAVDRCLEEERQSGYLRMFKLPASVDDYAYMLSEDYIACISSAEQDLREQGKDGAEAQIFQQFRNILSRYHETSIPHVKLVALLSKVRKQEGTAATVVKDSDLSPLFIAGLLTRDVGQQSRYLFAVPGAGRVISSITKGRKEILGMLARKRYKEAFTRDMHRWTLRGSCLDMQWHLRDLTGRGSVQIDPTPSGPMVRLVKKT